MRVCRRSGGAHRWATVLAFVGMVALAFNSDFLVDAELLTETSLEQDLRYMTDATPGAASARGYLGFLGDTEFDTDRGFYSQPFEVTITATEPFAEIYYTTDGSEPSPANPAAALYDDPVPIATTTMLRAAAFEEGYLSTNVDTQTYIFLEDVVVQDPINDPSAPNYPTVWQAGASADFEMDPDVVALWDDQNPANTDFGIREALQSIPTMSIVMDHDDLWHSSSGIYPNATNSGTGWRRPGSIEYFDPQTGEEFQYNVGVQMHGNVSRDNVRLKKHSFRLIFSDEFNGPGTLPYQLFEDSSLDSINTLVLRACFTDSFATRTSTDRYSPLDSQYTRDVWVRDTQLAMGHLSSHSTFVHLYINGLYWGLYNPSERPDDAFMAAYFGGAREDWDIVKDYNQLFRGDKTAWNAMFALANQLPGAADPDAIYQRLQGNNSDGTPNPAFPNYLDIDNLVDFMILHLYTGAEDWPDHNWYAARNRVDPGRGYKFFVWDQEIVLDGRFRDRTDVDDDFSPAELYDKLRNSPEFRLHFADRLQEHLYGDGALTTQANQARWMAISDEVEAAMIGESARWGDAREGEVVTVSSRQPPVTIPTMTVDHWRDARDDVFDYFAQSHQLTMDRFRAAGLSPAIDAPQFSRFGGAVPDGDELVVSATSGPIYYTLDGTDPRLLGGAVNPNASLIGNPGTTTTFVESGAPWAYLDDGSDQGTAWTQAGFDDALWNVGNAQLGYGEGDEQTVVDDGPEGNNKYTTTYFRHTFLASGVSELTGLTLRLSRDDGAVVFLNGEEVRRSNMPTTAISSTTFASDTVSGSNESIFFKYALDPGALVEGENVIAVEIHQATAHSSDLSFDLALMGHVESGGVIPITGTTHVSARVSAGGEWSSLTAATFTIHRRLTRRIW